MKLFALVLMATLGMNSALADTGDYSINDNGTVLVEVDELEIEVVDQETGEVEIDEFYVEASSSPDGVCKFLGYEHGAFRQSYRRSSARTDYNGTRTKRLLWFFRTLVNIQSSGRPKTISSNSDVIAFRSPPNLLRLSHVTCIPSEIPPGIVISDRYSDVLYNFVDRYDDTARFIRPMFRYNGKIHYFKWTSDLNGVCRKFGYERVSLTHPVEIKDKWLTQRLVEIDEGTRITDVGLIGDKFIEEITCLGE